MAPNPRVIKAFIAMRTLGFSDEEVKPVLKDLLKVYEGNWNPIEEDNYRLLVDAYFEFKEDKQKEDERIHIMVPNSRDKPPLKLRLADEGLLSSTKDNPATASSTAHLKEPIDQPGHGYTQGENIKSNHRNKGLIKPKIEQSDKTLLHASKPMSQPGSSEVSKGGHNFKHLSSRLDILKKDDNSECSYKRHSKSNIKIASSCSGEVKILLNCDSVLGQSNFQTRALDDVIKEMEKKYLRFGPKFSLMNLLNDVCDSYLKLVLNSKQNGSDHFDHTKSNSLLPLKRKAIAHEKRHPHFINDITKGAEKVEISLVDETGTKNMPKFNYIPHNIIYQNANVSISLARIADEDCCSGCSGDCLLSTIPCACARETGGEFAYTPVGLLKEDFITSFMSMTRDPQEHHFVYCQNCPLERSMNEIKPERCKGHLVRRFIKECWRKCGCDMQCGNRVVQRGIRHKLQVFLTKEGKGWGVRTLEDLPKGSFICEYIGEILTNMELYERNLLSLGNDRHTYPVTLDADWGSEGMLKDEEALCLDATYHGNVARFINHRCFDANLVDIPVEVETPDRHYYHLAFFSTRKVKAFEELTWDYGIDFDDDDHPIKAFRCHCGSLHCRDNKGKGKRKIESPKSRETQIAREKLNHHNNSLNR